jgi:recombination protein RecA
MNKVKKSILYAMVLGDGHISRDSPEFSICHGELQKDYLEYKAAMLKKLLSKEVNIYPISIRAGNKTYKAYRFSCTHKLFWILRKRCYDSNHNPKFSKEVLDKLTPQAIAIWYMDNGSLKAKKRNGKIHAYELTISCRAYKESDAQNIVDYFANVHCILFTIKQNKGRFSIRCGTIEARKFVAMVKPYIIDSLLYKISM